MPARCSISILSIFGESPSTLRPWNIDTGASTNLIGHHFLKGAEHHFSLQKRGSWVTTVGHGGQKVRQALQVEQVLLGGFPLPPMRCVVGNLKTLNLDLVGCTLHGLLGYEFLKHYQVEIHFQAKKLRLWQWRATPPAPALANK